MVIHISSNSNRASDVSIEDFRAELINGTSADVSAMLEEHASGETIVGASVGDLLLAADNCLDAQQFDLARSYINSATRLHEETPAAHEKMGHLERLVGNDDAAIAAFTAAVELDETCYGAWFGLGSALMAADDMDAALAATDHIVNWEEPYSTSELHELIRRVSEHHFLAGERARLEQHFRYLARTSNDPVIKVRLVDILNKCGKADEARHIVESFEAIESFGPWEKCIIAETLLDTGGEEQAREIMEGVLTSGHKELHFVRVFLRCQTGEEDLSDSEKSPLKLLASIGGPAGVAGQFLTMAAHGDFEGAVKLFCSAPEQVCKVTATDAINMGYQLMANGELELCTTLVAQVRKVGVDSFPLQALEINLAMASQHYDDAEVLVSKAEPRSLHEVEDLDLKAFEIKCFRRDLDAAAEDAISLMRNHRQRERFAAPIIRFLAERREWDRLCDFVLEEDTPIVSITHCHYVVFKAFSRVGRSKELLDKLDMSGGPGNDESLKALRDGLVEAQFLETAEGAIPDVRDSVAVRRMELTSAIKNAPEPSQEPAKDEAVFFCTNKSYRCGTAVALHSMIQSNPEFCRELDIYVATDEEDGVSERAFKRMSEVTGCRITIINASELVSDPELLGADYGLFTSGEVLSISAYYRIFVAKYLWEHKLCNRAAYFDSDLVVKQDISNLFSASLRGRALGARRENIRPEVEQAARMHGIQANEYFNSGVLLFEMNHVRFEECIERTMRCIQDGNLLFHDQCALNGGFRGNVSYLPTGLNFFLPPSLPVETSLDEAEILHYLDRPKPWEPMYRHPAGLIWLEGLSKLMEEIGPLLVRMLMNE